MTVSTETESPVENGVGLGTPLRLVLVYGHRESSRRAAARIALASCAEVRAVVPADDPRSFAELAQDLRDAEPDAVLACAADVKDVDAALVLLEALRLGCAAQRPPPRVLALGPDGVVERLPRYRRSRSSGSPATPRRLPRCAPCAVAVTRGGRFARS